MGDPVSSTPETKGHQRRCRDDSAHNERVEKLLYDRKSAAYALSISVRSVDYLLSQRAFRTRKIGKKVLIPASELKRFAAADHFGPIKSRAL
jgi:hypothetical protein